VFILQASTLMFAITHSFAVTVTARRIRVIGIHITFTEKISLNAISYQNVYFRWGYKSIFCTI